MDWNIQNLIQWTSDYLKEKGISSPRLDAELLLAQVLQLERIQLYTQFDRPLQEMELQSFKALLKRRAGREPLAYILGEKEFYSLGLQVNPSVLIPRPETEALVEMGLSHLGNHGPPPWRLLDLATGTGCVLLALLKLLPEARGIGADISPGALEVAAENARRFHLEDRVRWIPQDLAQGWDAELAGPFDLITANLPYVPAAEFAGLEPEIRDYEPREALVPGPGGLEAFAWVLPKLASRLKPGGLALLEFGAGQEEKLGTLCRTLTPELSVGIHRDLAGRPRVLALSPTPSPALS